MPDRLSLQTSARIVHEALTVYRFAVIGILATLVHMTVAWSVVAKAGAAPLFANLCGFAVAFSLSFTGQYLWTFRSSRHWADAAWRFAVIAGMAFLVNSLCLLALLKGGILSGADATIAATCVMPVVSYLGNRYWALI